jgi:hypothetical protein
VKESENGRLVRFLEQTDRSCVFSWSICDKNAILLGVLRATVSKVMPAYTNHEKTTSVKRKSGQNSTLTERDCHTLRRIVSKNHRTTAAQLTAKLNMYSS